MEGTGSSQTDMIERLGLFLGDWKLDYKVPKSRFSEAATGTGTGTFSWALDAKKRFVEKTNNFLELIRRVWLGFRS